MDGGDLDCHFETDGEFVVEGGHGPVLLEAADSGLDRMPGLVVLPVEGGRAATGPATSLAVADLVGRFGNRAPDAAPPQVGAVSM